MIQSFSLKYKKLTAYLLFAVFYMQTIIQPLHAAIYTRNGNEATYDYIPTGDKAGKKTLQPYSGQSANAFGKYKKSYGALTSVGLLNPFNAPLKTNIGGPSSPEATSFKAVGSDNLVNLFTGDFSYSIPLLDVGGYPVNLFYSGGVSMEQEASWVGLGWNINPGSVSRNMRGVPDDFNGSDSLTQTQNVKPNRTWGGEVGIDGEVIGIKRPPSLNLSLGFSYNNYLGPELDLGAGVSLNLPISKTISFEKAAGGKDTLGVLNPSVGVGAKLSSRSGLTFSPSLNAGLQLKNGKDNIGVGISTAYNSRQGVRELNLSMSTSHFSKKDNNDKEEENNDKGHYTSGSLLSSSINFARPSYMPTLRMPMQYSNYSGQIELGVGMFGLRGAAHAQGYYSESKVPSEWQVVNKPLVGFIYSEKANASKDAVMDFNRLNDAEVTPNTPILSAPQYAYDIFSIQGEGTGGSIRAYRGDLGFMRDNETVSKDNNISIGADMAPSGHFGINWNIITTPTRAGGWEDGNNTLRQTMAFKDKGNNTAFENVYFRNPGETTVTDTQMIKRIGGDNLVRFKLEGSNVNPLLTSSLEQFNKKTISSKGQISIADTVHNIARDKRTQVTTMLTASEASKIGLDTVIKNYSGNFNSDTLAFNAIGRTAGFRKGHHISEIDVLEQSGMRYVYGLPVYNIIQKDYTFSVDTVGDYNTGMVGFTGDETTVGSHHMNNKDRLDGYVMEQETPAYASAFMITGLLSPDYVDVTGDGITEDDLGGAVKFNYNKSDSLHRWRTPRDNSRPHSAHFNEGLKSEKKDNKANISYGEREVWYLNTIESKSMIAVFKTESRSDAKGVVSDVDGRINASEDVNKRLKQIDLYTKAEIRAKGLTNARPVKTVHFTYTYALCHGTPDNAGGQGKLTLKSVYFSYNGQERVSKEKYVFNYGNDSTTSSIDNPLYAHNASDKWGTYKNPAATDSSANPSGLSNADYPFTSKNKTKNDDYAGAWSLKKILLPSGGQMEIQYEADDYAYVQDRRSCDMFNIYGLGNSANCIADSALYNNGLLGADNFYVYVKLAQPLQNTGTANLKQEILDKYLSGLNQLAFRILIDMPKGPEPLTVYAHYDDYGLCSNSVSKNVIYIKLSSVDGKSPLSNSAIGFLTENLPGQAFPGYDIDVDGVKAFLEMADGMLTGLKGAFASVDEQMRSAPKARTIFLGKSFVRLDNPFKTKYGGGARVKKVIVKDNWRKMLKDTGYTSTYGQEYDYTTTERINGKDTTISSGVASYEPGIGSEENPFREIVGFENKMPLASAQYGAIEMPMLEGFYPAPGVGYSKVTVRSIHRKGTHGDSSLRSAIGKQVTEFYTAKEYPVYSTNTPMTNMDYHYNSIFPLLYKEITDRRTTSQGFLVETNDMHGKMKSQAAYSETDEKTPLSYSYHSYKNTGKNGMNDKVDFVFNEKNGAIESGNMGIDMELMTDVREFRTQTNGFNGQLQTDFFTFVPFPFFVIPMLPIKTYTENKYRAVTCTKLINYHAIEDSVIVMDKGSVISTKTIAYDAETGIPIVTKTANEFNDAIYNTTYPAYWGYSGMQPAYKNINRQFSGVNFYDGLITGTAIDQANIFEGGDELYITNAGADSAGCVVTSGTGIFKLWAFDKGNKNFIFLDKAGKPFTRNGVSFRIVRSGKRNDLGLVATTITSMKSPVVTIKFTTKRHLVNTGIDVVAASAAEFKAKWQVDNDAFKRYTLVYPSSGSELITNGDFSSGNSGFTSAYSYHPASYVGGNAGTYTVGSNPHSWNTDLVSCADHTGSGGNMLLVNGASTAISAWSQTVTVTDSTNYVFSFWLNQLYPVSNPQIQFKVNGVQVGSVYDLSGTGTWQQVFFNWSSGASTSAVISIVDLNTGLLGNDFAVDDISMKLATCGIQPIEVQDCSNGYLEKSINPYVKGLVGNFKPYRSYTYYGTRNEVRPDTITAIRKMGFIADFASFWNFDTTRSVIVPDYTNSKWVWNSELTKVNGKGQELETKDALNRYTAAQYGFAKNMPVAMTQNARYGESFAESFEDYSYQETINTSTPACDRPYVNLTADIDTSNSHTGRNAMMVNASTDLVKALPVSNSIIDSFNLQFPTAPVITDVTTPTGSYSLGPNASPASPSTTTTITFHNLDMFSTIEESGCTLSTPMLYYNGSKSRFYRSYTTVQNIKISDPNIYTFVLNATQSYDYLIGGTGTADFDRADIDISITTLDGQEVLYSSLYSDQASTKTEKVFLNCGSYIITCLVSSEIEFPGNYTCVHTFQSKASYTSNVTGATGFVTSCYTTKPIPANDSMMNAAFRIVPGKKMQFSAWVKGNCTTSPCLDFDQSNIEIWANGSALSGANTTIRRTGAIIEGWQKIEGEFTLPIGTTTAEIHFINGNPSVSMYVDDIRIHPFNANMKSYVYDSRTLRLSAELDENNYSSIYEYDAEGQLVRVKKETSQGIKTINETRAAKQKNIQEVQP